MNENVIDFNLKAKDQKLGVKKRSFNTCGHNKMLVDEHLQQMECKDCGEVISAWEYILNVAKKEQRLFDHIKYSKIERSKLDAELIDLKRKIRNAKSQLNRAIK